MRGRTTGRDEDATLRLVLDHAAELLRFARRFSHCADDAHDAYQRAVEILVRRVRVEPPEQPLSWMRTVLRHEALAVRREREQLVGRVEIDLDRHEDRAVADPAEQAVGDERLRHTAEALGRLKPQEATALVLRAEGLSYREICTRTGWSYTRTNRSVTEGRRALRERLGAIESGTECERWLPLLSALADREAPASDLAQLRPHLRSCAACRATLRELHAMPAHVAMLVPPALVELSLQPHGGSLVGHAELTLHALAERALTLAARMQGTVETLPGAKLAAVAASTAALAGGGVALQHAAHRPASPRAATAAVDPRDAQAPGGRLATSAFPLSTVPASTHRMRGPNASDGEFPSGSAEPSEFTARPPANAEFTAAPSQVAGTASSAHAAVAAPSVSSAPPEFAGP